MTSLLFYRKWEYWNGLHCAVSIFQLSAQISSHRVDSDHPISSLLLPPAPAALPILYLIGLSQGAYKKEEKFANNYEKKAEGLKCYR